MLCNVGMDRQNYDIVVLGDMRDLYHHGCNAVMAELTEKVAEISSNYAVFFGMDWQENQQECLDAKLVIINGEGSLHHDKPVIAQIIELAKLRKERGVRTVLLNSSWLNNSDDLAQEMSVFDLICVRDGVSYQALQEHHQNLLFVPDFAIARAMKFKTSDSEKRGVAVGDSTKAKVTKDLRQFAGSRGWEFFSILANPLEKKDSNKARKIFYKTRLAKLLCGFDEKLMPRYFSHRVGADSLEGYLQQLSSFSAVVTGRFHTVCMCIALRVPFVAISSNTSKIESVLADVGLDVEQRFTKLESLERLDVIPDFSDEELGKIDEYLERAGQGYSNLWERVRELAKP